MHSEICGIFHEHIHHMSITRTGGTGDFRILRYSWKPCFVSLSGGTLYVLNFEVVCQSPSVVPIGFRTFTSDILQ